MGCSMVILVVSLISEFHGKNIYAISAKPLEKRRIVTVKFSMELPVQFRDIDSVGHVNHAVYLQYMETARVEFLRGIGELDGGFYPRVILASARCEYYHPITDERRVTVTLWVSRIGNKSWDFDYTVENSSGLLYASGRTTIVAYDYKKESTAPITGSLRQKLEEHLEKPIKFRGAE